MRKSRLSNDGTTDVWINDVLPAPEGECRSMTRPDSSELTADVASRSRPKNSSFLQNGRGPTYGFVRLVEGSSSEVPIPAEAEDAGEGEGEGDEVGSFMMGSRFLELFEELGAAAPIHIEVVGAEVVL